MNTVPASHVIVLRRKVWVAHLKLWFLPFTAAISCCCVCPQMVLAQDAFDSPSVSKPRTTARDSVLPDFSKAPSPQDIHYGPYRQWFDQQLQVIPLIGLGILADKSTDALEQADIYAAYHTRLGKATTEEICQLVENLPQRRRAAIMIIQTLGWRDQDNWPVSTLNALVRYSNSLPTEDELCKACVYILAGHCKRLSAEETMRLKGTTTNPRLLQSLNFQMAQRQPPHKIAEPRNATTPEAHQDVPIKGEDPAPTTQATEVTGRTAYDEKERARRKSGILESLKSALEKMQTDIQQHREWNDERKARYANLRGTGGRSYVTESAELKIAQMQKEEERLLARLQEIQNTENSNVGNIGPYRKYLFGKIGDVWNPTQEARLTILIELAQNGEVRRVEVLESSGNETFDSETVHTVKNIYFYPLPDWYKGKTLPFKFELDNRKESLRLSRPKTISQ